MSDIFHRHCHHRYLPHHLRSFSLSSASTFLWTKLFAFQSTQLFTSWNHWRWFNLSAVIGAVLLGHATHSWSLVTDKTLCFLCQLWILFVYFMQVFIHCNRYSTHFLIHCNLYNIKILHITLWASIYHVKNATMTYISPHHQEATLYATYCLAEWILRSVAKQYPFFRNSL